LIQIRWESSLDEALPIKCQKTGVVRLTEAALAVVARKDSRAKDEEVSSGGVGLASR